MHLKYHYETMKIGDKVIAVPVGDDSEKMKEVIKLNGTAAAIFDLLKKDISEEMIVDTLAKRYDVSKETLIRDIHLCLEGFQNKNLLD